MIVILVIWSNNDQYLKGKLLSNFKLRHTKSQNLNVFLSCPAIAFAQFIEARCEVENEDVVTTTTTTSEWSTILLPHDVFYVRGLTVVNWTLHSLSTILYSKLSCKYALTEQDVHCTAWQIPMLNSTHTLTTLVVIHLSTMKWTLSGILTPILVVIHLSIMKWSSSGTLTPSHKFVRYLNTKPLLIQLCCQQKQWRHSKMWLKMISLVSFKQRHPEIYATFLQVSVSWKHNTVWPCDDIWQHRARSALAQVKSSQVKSKIFIATRQVSYIQ